MTLLVPRLPEPVDLPTFRDGDTTRPGATDPGMHDPGSSSQKSPSRDLQAAWPAWHKPSYAHLATSRWQWVAALTGLAAGVVVSRQGMSQWPALVPLASCGAALVLVDALTTYLPRRLSHLCAALTAIGVLGCSWLAHDPQVAAHSLVAALLSLLFFWGLWRLGAGFGFGDVRLAPQLAGAAACLTTGTAARAVLLGTVVGAGWGLIVALWRRLHPHPLGAVFAYGPSLWLGLWLALLL